MTDEGRALLIVAALLSGASASAGFVGGRMTAPVPPAEVRYVPVSAPPIEVIAEPAPIAPPAEPAVPAPAEAAAPVEVKPVKPLPRPKVEVKPKEQPKPKSRPPAPKKTLPSCAVVKREYQTMSWAQQMAAYRRATPDEIAHGKRCLGF